MYFPLLVEVLCLSLFWYALRFVLSSFAIILKRKRELAALLYCLSYVLLLAVPWVGLSVVGDCGISWSYSLTFWTQMHARTHARMHTHTHTHTDMVQL